MNKRSLVTGAAGFIGSNLVNQLLADGWHVVGVDDLSSGHLDLLDFQGQEFKVLSAVEEVVSFKRDNFELLVCDFASDWILSMVETGHFDVVFHLAAIPRVSFSVENPSLTNDTNVGKTVQLLEACISATPAPVFVFSSSSSVYGGADVLPTPETHPTDPKSPYALQKRVIEDYLKVFHNLYGLDSVALRYFNVVGPGQYGDSPYSTAVSAWCHAIKHNLPCRLDGDGEQSRDMAPVEQVVQANIKAALAMLSDKKYTWDGRQYNVACGERRTNNQILDMFRARFPQMKVVNAPSRVGDVRHTQADVTRAAEELGYSVDVRFPEALERTWKWWGI